MANTIIAPSAAGLTTLLLEQRCGGNRGVRLNFGALTNGILAGLVSITAGCNAVEPWAALVIGMIGSFFYIGSTRMMTKMKIDDPIEATQVHGFCGIWGVLAVGLLAKDKGLLYGADGSGKLFGAQCLGILAITAWVAVLTAVFMIISKKMDWLRMPPETEVVGGDIHYFAPMQFQGRLYQYDIELGIAK